MAGSAGVARREGQRGWGSRHNLLIELVHQRHPVKWRNLAPCPGRLSGFFFEGNFFDYTFFLSIYFLSLRFL